MRFAVFHGIDIKGEVEIVAPTLMCMLSSVLTMVPSCAFKLGTGQSKASGERDPLNEYRKLPTF